jgi:hypothetical protein
MLDVNSTLPLLEPVSSTVSGVLNLVSILVGGIFGIYVLSLILKIVFFKKTFDMLKQLNSRMDTLEKKIGRLGRKKQ